MKYSYIIPSKQEKQVKNKSYSLKNSYPKSYYTLRRKDIIQATQVRILCGMLTAS